MCIETFDIPGYEGCGSTVHYYFFAHYQSLHPALRYHSEYCVLRHTLSSQHVPALFLRHFEYHAAGDRLNCANICSIGSDFCALLPSPGDLIQTPIILAAERDLCGVVKVLAEHSTTDLNLQDSFGRTPVHW